MSDKVRITYSFSSVPCIYFNDSIDPITTEQLAEIYLNSVRAEQLQEENERLREALEFYAKNVNNCNRIGDEGDIARNTLARDIGKVARESLKER